MREIKFRGLEIMTGDWVYGSHVRTGVGRNYILPQNLIAIDIPQYHVDGDTVGQYTGLSDKNDKEIYEGDIIQTSLSKQEKFAYECYYHEEEGSFFFAPFMIGDKTAPLIGIEEFSQRWEEVADCENIGNIHDNPELLEVGSDKRK
jgi:uncharacterized phage protein (TIGR01671 family)